MAVCDPQSAELLQKIQAKMAELERLVGELGGLVTQLAGPEDTATARAVERTRQAFARVRGRQQSGPERR